MATHDSKPTRDLKFGKESTVSPARREAFAILLAVARGEAHSDDLLRSPRVSALSAQDRHLCTTLTLGVLRWQLYLDQRIRPFLAKPNARLDDEVAIALRLATFQLWFLDRIPAHAAISESVTLTRKAGHRFASGMVNAVLRKAAAQGREATPDARQAYPEWMVNRWTALYGAEAAQAICSQGQTIPETALRLASHTGEPGQNVETTLAAESITLAPPVLIQAARRVIAGDITAATAFRTGHARIQEEGSQLIAELSTCGSFQPQSILDCCAAPGGKTLILAELNPKARITACEISASRYEALQQRLNTVFADQPGTASRLQTVLGDITALALEASYDFVLADAPCSGTGTLGRNPEIRHRLTSEDLARHHERQCAILSAALNATSQPGSRIVYSTCSLEPEENEDVLEKVLSQAPDWRRISLHTILAELRQENRITSEGASLLQQRVSAEGALLLLPGSLGEQHATDGFFMAMLERTAPTSTSQP